MIEFDWEGYRITMVLTKPRFHGKKTFLTKRTCHIYLNHRPIDVQTKIKTVFFETYQEYKVGKKSMPFSMLHFQTDDHDSYDMSINLDQRRINFTPKWQADLWVELRERIKRAFTQELQNTPEGRGLTRE